MTAPAPQVAAIIVRRLHRLHDQIAHERAQELSRAVEYGHQGNDHMAGYHAGLADGRNAALAELRKMLKEYRVTDGGQ